MADDKVRVLCVSAPSLWIPHLGIQFVDGVAEVDPELVEQLAPFQAHGVTVDGLTGGEAEVLAEPSGADEPGAEVTDVDEPVEEPPVKPATKRAPRAKPFG